MSEYSRTKAEEYSRPRAGSEGAQRSARGAWKLPATGGSVRPGCPAYRPVQLKNNHPIVIVVTIVAIGQVRRKFVGAAFYSPVPKLYNRSSALNCLSQGDTQE